VDLGLIFGGETTTSFNVSRIEVREAMMGLSFAVRSQYRRFCD
jgi:hypothetical protein